MKYCKKVGVVAYRLALPPKMTHVHDVFHISMLNKYIPDPNHVLREEPVDLSDNISYKEETIKIIYEREQVLRTKTTKLVKVLWSNHVIEEETWESKDLMK